MGKYGGQMGLSGLVEISIRVFIVKSRRYWMLRAYPQDRKRVIHGPPGRLTFRSRFVRFRSYLVHRRGRRQTACKPGSVHTSRHETAIPLGRALLHASRDQPGRRGGNAPAAAVPRSAGRPYSVLLPMGFTLPPLSPGARCALAAPFHPCLRGRSRAGGLFSVALSLGSPPPAVSRHRIPVEPGLSSTGIAPGSGRPAVWRGGFARKRRARQAGPVQFE